MYTINTHIISQFEPKLIILQTKLTSLIFKIDDNLLTTTNVAKAKVGLTKLVSLL